MQNQNDIKKEHLAILMASPLVLPGLTILVGFVVWFSGFYHDSMDHTWSLMCHRQPERCLYIAGHLLPICARCTGLYFGAIIGSFLSLWPKAPARTNIPILWWFGLALFLLGFGDALGRTFIGWDTPLLARLISGAALGMGALYLAGAVTRTVIIHSTKEVWS